jgi:hypothetical protein
LELYAQQIAQKQPQNPRQNIASTLPHGLKQGLSICAAHIPLFASSCFETHPYFSEIIMKFVALISGGKDSFFNAVHCVSVGHELVAIANLRPPRGRDELDSFAFQTVGHEVIDAYAECLSVPLFRKSLDGQSLATDLFYEHTAGDEIEDLYSLLVSVKVREISSVTRFPSDRCFRNSVLVSKQWQQVPF